MANTLGIVVITAILAVNLSGCSGAKKKTPNVAGPHAGNHNYKLAQDIAPHPKEKIPDVHNIPDAKPKVEPKSKYGNPKSYTIFKKNYKVMPSSKGYKERGKASWYGKKFHGYRTSNGEVYDMYGMSAAHKTLPLPTYVKVTNLANGKTVVVKVNDRGPFHEDRIIDLSYAAAAKLGILGKGTGNVEVHALDPSETIEGPLQYLQVGSFKQEHHAKDMVLKLKKVAKNHPINVRKNPSKKNIYHVHIGPIQDETVISKLKQKLIINKFPNPIAVQAE